jgi:phenylacetate-CoA ligase
MKRVTIRGDMVVKADQMEPPFGVYNLAEKQLILSSYHLSERNMPWYIAAIRKFSPDAIQAYPSSIFALAGYMAEMNLPPLKTGAIFTSSEMLLEKQKEMIQRYFGSKVYDHYGNAERNVMFGTCEKGQYHVMPEYGFTEFLPVKGNKELYEIVGTSFINSAMPLIRYRTGDMVELGKSDCECGRAFQVVKRIIGRHDDLIVTPDGRKLGRLDHIFKEINGVHKAQIIQEKDYSLVIRVIPLKNYSKLNQI